MNLEIIGPPASGKGTQTKLLANKLGYNYLEMGDVLREIINNRTPLGRKLDQFLNKKGKLVPDKIIFQIAGEWLRKTKTGVGIIFDGFPRNLRQYLIFENDPKNKRKKIDRVIYLKVSPRISVKRISARRICPKCDTEFNLITRPPKKDEICDQCSANLIRRADDTPKIIQKRLTEYRRETQPLVNYLRKKKVLIEVNGEQSIKKIHQEILNFLNTLTSLKP